MITWKFNPFFEFVDNPENRTSVIVSFKGTTVDSEGTETPIEEQITIETDTTGVPFQVTYETLTQTFAEWKTRKLGDA